MSNHADWQVFEMVRNVAQDGDTAHGDLELKLSLIKAEFLLAFLLARLSMITLIGS